MGVLVPAEQQTHFMTSQKSLNPIVPVKGLRILTLSILLRLLGELGRKEIGWW